MISCWLPAERVVAEDPVQDPQGLARCCAGAGGGHLAILRAGDDFPAGPSVVTVDRRAGAKEAGIMFALEEAARQRRDSMLAEAQQRVAQRRCTRAAARGAGRRGPNG